MKIHYLATSLGEEYLKETLTQLVFPLSDKLLIENYARNSLIKNLQKIKIFVHRSILYHDFA